MTTLAQLHDCSCNDERSIVQKKPALQCLQLLQEHDTRRFYSRQSNLGKALFVTLASKFVTEVVLIYSKFPRVDRVCPVLARQCRKKNRFYSRQPEKLLRFVRLESSRSQGEQKKDIRRHWVLGE